ncbi:hypothetical protein K1T35_11580 [Pseudonocardia sp. DSM 110487]|uniref:hypothetical protein n=1 Tax=Pseudonocardia sp. DSM 110487 TaxID=2865833 RepID=UPI001C69CA83|nr:hypothetical protein [Pseudonocardia sp. DSM 110487]QYN37819.1 hypothetical protein K1T35_11580 [Pseudonocardia sp. DSM 110487]
MFGGDLGDERVRRLRPVGLGGEPNLRVGLPLGRRDLSDQAGDVGRVGTGEVGADRHRNAGLPDQLDRDRNAGGGERRDPVPLLAAGALLLGVGEGEDAQLLEPIQLGVQPDADRATAART